MNDAEKSERRITKTLRVSASKLGQVSARVALQL